MPAHRVRLAVGYLVSSGVADSTRLRVEPTGVNYETMLGNCTQMAKFGIEAVKVGSNL